MKTQRCLVLYCALIGAAPLLLHQEADAQQLPPVQTPPQNPITEQKRVLGKILFWDTQLSSDGTIACGSCHTTFAGSGDARFGEHPGADGVFGNDDDVLGSPGMAASSADGKFILDDTFNTAPQVTGRAANVSIMAQFAPELFWDGRATGTFTDPQTGAVLIPNGGALESQSIGPILSSVEMAYEGRTWDDVTNKLEAAYPMALATDLPSDVAAAIASNPSYPALFAAAFGDGEISAARIAFALATYERTLVPDESPWDLFQAGVPGALSPQEFNGMQVFNNPGARCSICHQPPFFTDFQFRNIGLRPWQEDDGRRGVTGNFNDRGRFKTATLRNAGLKFDMMHNGQIEDARDAVDFYLEAGGHQQFDDGKDPLINGIAIPPGPARDNLAAFISTGLTDPRVANETFPFDRPLLWTELDDANPSVGGSGSPGSGGLVPSIIATSPPNLGNSDFRIGLTNALGGSVAYVAFSSHPPEADGVVEPEQFFGPFSTGSGGSGEGVATWNWSIPDADGLLGGDGFIQWFVEDPSAKRGFAHSPVAAVSFYRVDPLQCKQCDGDSNCDNVVDTIDLISLLGCWNDLGGRNDINKDGVVSVPDLITMLERWGPCDG